jgi:hypothetical protein
MFGGITVYGFTGKYEYGHGYDHTGQEMVEVRFEKASDAQFLLDHVNKNQPGGKIHFVNGKYSVQLGPKRFEMLFGAEGAAGYAAALAQLRNLGINRSFADQFANLSINKPAKVAKSDKREKKDKIVSNRDKLIAERKEKKEKKKSGRK